MRSVIFAVLLGAACAASAQMYRWTDENGPRALTDTPPPPSAKNVQKKCRQRQRGTASAETAGLPYAVQLAAKSFPVTSDGHSPAGDRGPPSRVARMWRRQLRRSFGRSTVPPGAPAPDCEAIGPGDCR